jgi:cystathionine beta-lyase
MPGHSHGAGMQVPADCFDHCPDRHGTDSLKWERWAGRDVLPLWVADMDVVSPPAVLEALHRRIDHGVFGYTIESARLRATACAWLERRHDWSVTPESLVFVPGVVSGFNQFIRAIGQVGDGHLVHVPAYPPLLQAPGLHGQRLQRVPLTEGADGFSPTAEALAAATDERTRSLLLCSPHNPTGRVFTSDELALCVEHCRRHNLWICSDEIWADLVLDGVHVPFARFCTERAPDLLARTVTLMAPSKTFNIAGLGCALAIIPDADLRRRFIAAGHGLVPHVPLTGLVAAEAAWSQGDAWLDGLLDHLRGNRALVMDACVGLPQMRVHVPQATYLAWCDARSLGLDPAAVLLAHGLGLSEGRDFGASGWLRLNFGCPRDRLREALVRLTAAVI